MQTKGNTAKTKQTMTYSFDKNSGTLYVIVTRGEHAMMTQFRSMEGRRMESAIKEKADDFTEQHGKCEVKMVVKNEN